MLNLKNINTYITNFKRRSIVDNLLINTGQTFFPITKLLLSRFATEIKIGNKIYKPQISKYGMTWNTERCIEIPYFIELVKDTKKDILEIGNVLSHYSKSSWDIVDKYEIDKKNNVINIDIAEYKTNKKYDLIISISTLEHIGFDEEKVEKEKIDNVIRHIKTFLKKDGRLIFSMPLNYNKNFQEKLISKKIRFSSAIYLIRTGRFMWKQDTEEKALKHQYNKPYEAANAIGIYTIHS